MKYICPKCGEEHNLHFNLDYTKAERPVIDVLCNECGTTFNNKPAVDTNYGHLGDKTSLVPSLLEVYGSFELEQIQKDFDHVMEVNKLLINSIAEKDEEIKTLRHQLDLETAKNKILALNNRAINELFTDKFNPILVDNENMRLKLREINSKTNIQKAADILIKNNLKSIELGRFGIYYQDELAGARVYFELLSKVDSLPQEDIEELYDLLEFLTEDRQKYIYETLRFPEDGQHTLHFHNDGRFTYRNFII